MSLPRAKNWLLPLRVVGRREQRPCCGAPCRCELPGREEVGKLRVTVAACVFNVLSDAAVLGRNVRQNSPTANYVTSILAPRVARFDLQVRF